jgi:hypothetical protein
MTRPPRLLAGGATLLLAAGLVAGCASASPTPAAVQARAATASLATSLIAAGGNSWAVVPMGGSAAQENLFWELFTRPAASTQWELVTPPGVADNGGLVAAGPAGRRLDVAFRPSQGLTFSPLASTANGGQTWGTGLIDAPVAAVPDALAAAGTGMLALLGDGGVEQAAATGAGWTTLAAPGAVAASAAGRRCLVTGLTAVAYTPAGTPLVGAACARPGIAGIFARTGGTWQAAGPALTGTLAAQPVRVLRLAAVATGDVALLQAGTGAGASLLAAWTAGGSGWSLSPPLTTGTSQVLASGTGAGGSAWVLLSDGRAETIAGPAAWRQLPAPPRGTAALAAGPAGAVDALAVSGGKLTIYQLTPAGAWRETQAISVPIQYGSSS